MKNRIKKARQNKNWTQQQLAEVSGINVSVISRTERGINEPSPETLMALSQVLEVDLSHPSLRDEDGFVYGKVLQKHEPDTEKNLMLQIIKEHPPEPSDHFCEIRRISKIDSRGQTKTVKDIPYLRNQSSLNILLSEGEAPEKISVLPLKQSLILRQPSKSVLSDQIWRPLTEGEKKVVELIPEESYQGFSKPYFRADLLDPHLRAVNSILRSSPSKIFPPIIGEEGEWLSLLLTEHLIEAMKEYLEKAQETLDSILPGSPLDKKWGAALRKYLEITPKILALWEKTVSRNLKKSLVADLV